MPRLSRSDKRRQRDVESRMKYLEEDEFTARRAVIREELAELSFMRREPLEDYVPDDDHLLPDEGHWIQVKFAPHTEIPIEYLSIWYAIPVYKAENWSSYVQGNHKRYMVKILTPIGEVWLFPHEYQKVSVQSFAEYINMAGEDPDESQNHTTIHWLDPRNDHFDIEKLFYIRSRGIEKADAYKMLLGEIQTQHTCYITFNVEYQRIFAGVGVSSLNAREVMEKHIDYCLMEKAAGRWYNTQPTKLAA